VMRAAAALAAAAAALVLRQADDPQLRWAAASDADFPPCSCGCCITHDAVRDGGLVCGQNVPGFTPTHAAIFATCAPQCTLDRDFVLHSKFGDLYDTERFCFMHCEPSSATLPAGGECRPLSEDTVRRTYENTTSNRESLGHLDGAAGHVYIAWIGMSCGESGKSCDADNGLKIFEGAEKQPANRKDTSACVHTCESDVACGGFMFEPGADGSDDGNCVFRKNTRCNVAKTHAEDCYTKPTGMPIVNDLGNGIAPVTTGDVPDASGAIGYSCALFHPSEICADGHGLWCHVRRQRQTCAKECGDRGLLCIGASSSLAGCPKDAEESLLMQGEPTYEAPDLGDVPSWYSSMKKPYGSTSQYHVGMKEVKAPKDLTDAPPWFVREAQAGHLSGQYHLDTAPVPEEVVNNGTDTETTPGPGMLTCDTEGAATCRCGIMQ